MREGVRALAILLAILAGTAGAKAQDDLIHNRLSTSAGMVLDVRHV